MPRALSLLLLFVFAAGSLCAADAVRTISFALDPTPGRLARHGVEKLNTALRAAGWITQAAGDADRITDRFLILAGTSAAKGPAARALRGASVTLPARAEAFVVRRITIRGQQALVLCGADDCGLMLALLDAATRVGESAHADTDPFSEIPEVSK